MHSPGQSRGSAVENNALSLGDAFGSQGGKYFEGAFSLDKELASDDTREEVGIP